MSEEGFFSKYISQPVKKFYNYITGKTEESDNVQSTADDIVQESSESLDTHVQSNENDII
ncbi:MULTISPECIES: hypothetical protein [Wolbachia]|uniref:Uncharacterized protein n=1 Tax=Wolbachia pipientis TaxID=955 RepID=A0A6I6CKZ9_WOLPI|nr:MULTISPECIES: hypothetical protein [Wolbachia]MDX5488073.1 hypothetical protein [Wolbachia endosymbiont of Andrena praecox]MDX5498215.1 hypothetical protein [Wolbachia endosymbiont of Lasioglossum nitidulum]MDX5510481.1 hypothetical protein [Wolbachia endosymbiont of Lasioglossum morio]MDX5543107.1 hypothetical protein [Wolbachia endosymbiont of Andrena apicata]MDX5561665.1 hypothetical protein [Wolbachia endosymbiont of Andrena bicolor]MDX5595854.1 hypothetical protein [Wolbachia endosymb